MYSLTHLLHGAEAFREINRSSASPEIPRILWNRIHERPATFFGKKKLLNVKCVFIFYTTFI